MYVIPSGVNEEHGGTSEINIVHYLKAQFKDEELEEIINVAFDECYSMKPDMDSRYTPIERFLKIKGWAKATADKKSVTILWRADKGYEIWPWRKMYNAPKVHYTPIPDKVLRLENNYKPEKWLRQ